MAGCSAPPSPENERQIAALQAIADLERDVSSYAASRKGIRAAEAHIREGAAIVIVTRADGEEITGSVVDEIVRYVGERTGMGKERIAVKAKPPGGDPR